MPRTGLASWAALINLAQLQGYYVRAAADGIIRSRGEAHRPVRVRGHRGAGASMATGEADRRAGASVIIPS